MAELTSKCQLQLAGVSGYSGPWSVWSMNPTGGQILHIAPLKGYACGFTYFTDINILPNLFQSTPLV